MKEEAPTPAPRAGPAILRARSQQRQPFQHPPESELPDWAGPGGVGTGRTGQFTSNPSDHPYNQIPTPSSGMNPSRAVACRNRRESKVDRTIDLLRQSTRPNQDQPVRAPNTRGRGRFDGDAPREAATEPGGCGRSPTRTRGSVRCRGRGGCSRSRGRMRPLRSQAAVYHLPCISSINA